MERKGRCWAVIASEGFSHRCILPDDGHAKHIWMSKFGKHYHVWDSVSGTLQEG